ncbi:polysaccharide deacetylase family protein [Chitinimonas sp.]|uniref:polysaccharide deacetylase family protein n=1 Tax=Chitinimonas sp. TaxID=1934313 RepID=UPI0035B0036A
MLLALKIDIDTVAAARSSTPKLIELLQHHQAQASFYFALGPDRSGRSNGPLFRIGEHRSQQTINRRLSGPRGLARLYGNVLPAPLLARQAQAEMKQVQQAGFELGFTAWDRVNWVKLAQQADEAWYQQEIATANAAFASLFGHPARSMAAPLWRASRPLFRLQQRMGMRFGSDCRGHGPFLPVVDGEPVAIAQLPTTLPLLQELIGADGLTEQDAVQQLLRLSRTTPPYGHVFTIHAGSDCGKRLPLLQALLAGWQEQGYRLVSLQQLFDTLDASTLPWHTLEQQSWEGFAGKLASQGQPFPPT